MFRTPLIIREWIDTNMSTICIYWTIRQVVFVDTLQMLTHRSSSSPFTGTVSADRLLRDLCMVYVVHVLFVIIMRQFFVLVMSLSSSSPEVSKVLDLTVILTDRLDKICSKYQYRSC